MIDLDLHSTRRTLATKLITSGVDPATTQQLMRHKTIDMTIRLYAKINNQQRQSAILGLCYGRNLVTEPAEAPSQDGG